MELRKYEIMQLPKTADGQSYYQLSASVIYEDFLPKMFIGLGLWAVDWVNRSSIHHMKKLEGYFPVVGKGAWEDSWLSEYENLNNEKGRILFKESKNLEIVEKNIGKPVDVEIFKNTDAFKKSREWRR